MSTNKHKLYENIMRNVGYAVSGVLNEAKRRTSLDRDIDAYNDVFPWDDPKRPDWSKASDMDRDWRDKEYRKNNYSATGPSAREDDYKRSRYWDGDDEYVNIMANDRFVYIDDEEDKYYTNRYLSTKHDGTIESVFGDLMNAGGYCGYLIKEMQGKYWVSDTYCKKPNWREYLFIEFIDETLDIFTQRSDGPTPTWNRGKINGNGFLMIPRNINPDRTTRIHAIYSDGYANRPIMFYYINPETWLYLILKYCTKGNEDINPLDVARHYDEYVPTIRKNFRNRARYGE